MRAKDRCKAVKNGDRCRKERGHDSVVAISPDPEHEGINLKWGGERDVEKHDMTRAKELKNVNRMLNVFNRSDEVGRRSVLARIGENGFRAVQNFVRKGAKQ